MSMKKWLATALACSALLTACGSQSQSQGQASAPAGAQGGEKVYRVAMNAEFAPFEFMDSANNIQGFDVDLVNAMAKAGNFKVEFKHQPWGNHYRRPQTNHGFFRSILQNYPSDFGAAG